VPRFADPLRGGAGVPDLQRVPGLRGVVASDPIGTPYGQGWQHAMLQMRAAGLI
jgi:hypothetical protein